MYHVKGSGREGDSVTIVRETQGQKSSSFSKFPRPSRSTALVLHVEALVSFETRQVTNDLVRFENDQRCGTQRFVSFRARCY